MKYYNSELNNFKEFLKESKIAIIGLGVSNVPLLDYFYNLKIKNVFIFEHREKIEEKILAKIKNYNYTIENGENCLEKLKGFDIIFRSPSCLPTVKELSDEIKNGAIVTTEIEMFMRLFPGKIIGITGSDGKTTTTNLIYNILKNNGFNCYLGGNCGIPLFTKLDVMQPKDIAVIELSSFQLMGMTMSPDISIVTNVTPNHLNVHSSYEEYINAKKNIFINQNENGIVVLNYDNEITRRFGKEANGKVIYFSSKEKLEDGIILDNDIIKECNNKLRRHILSTDDLILKGKHMYEDVCAAIAVTQNIIDIENTKETLKKFNGVEHRLEFVRELDGVRWYNDSIGTSPTRTIAGLSAFKERITLIAGGYDKKLDYNPIAKPILDKVENLILMGGTAGKIFEVVKSEQEKEKKQINIYMCEDLNDAVSTAKKVTKKGQVVLLSPASASFDMFKNFEDRGNQFKSMVNNL